MSCAIRTEGLGCYYDRGIGRRRERFWALKDVTFEVPEGASFAIVGNNGAGKSTLLQVLAGIMEPDVGAVDRGGRTATLLSLNAGLQPNLSGRDNAIISGLLLGLKHGAIAPKLEEIKEYSGLGDFFEQPVRTYSSGMRARLGFAAALHIEPDILLIDEVVGVGDTQFRKKSAGFIRDRLDSTMTIVMVSHSLPLLRETCTRALWIERGTVRAVGETDAVIDAYNRSGS